MVVNIWLYNAAAYFRYLSRIFALLRGMKNNGRVEFPIQPSKQYDSRYNGYFYQSSMSFRFYRCISCLVDTVRWIIDRYGRFIRLLAVSFILFLNKIYVTNKQSKNGIVISYIHIVPENKIIKIGIRKNDRKLYGMLFLTLAKQFKNKVIAPEDNVKTPKIDQVNAMPLYTGGSISGTGSTF